MRVIIAADGAYHVDIVEYNHPSCPLYTYTHIERYPEIIDSPSPAPHFTTELVKHCNGEIVILFDDPPLKVEIFIFPRLGARDTKTRR